jgi:hypothetical protein
MSTQPEGASQSPRQTYEAAAKMTIQAKRVERLVLRPGEIDGTLGVEHRGNDVRYEVTTNGGEMSKAMRASLQQVLGAAEERPYDLVQIKITAAYRADSQTGEDAPRIQS